MLDFKQSFRTCHLNPTSTKRPSLLKSSKVGTESTRLRELCHLSCMAITSTEYNHLANTLTTWICSSCNSPNHKRIFDSIPAVSYSFESLSLEQTSDSFHSLTVCSPSSSLGSPKATSSPRKPQRELAKPVKQSLRTVVINLQSIKNKVQEAQVLIESAEPGIILVRKNG